MRGVGKEAKNMDKEYTSFPTGIDMRGNGEEGNKVGKAVISFLMEIDT